MASRVCGSAACANTAQRCPATMETHSTSTANRSQPCNCSITRGLLPAWARVLLLACILPSLMLLACQPVADLLEVFLPTSARMWHDAGSISRSNESRTVLPMDGWVLAGEVKELRVFTKQDEDATSFSIRILADLETGAAECVCLARELDLLPTWNKFTSPPTGLLRIHSETLLTGLVVLTLPWPIPQLASVFRAEMRDDLGGAIVLVAGPDESTPLPAAAASLRQLQLKHAFVHLSPLPSSPRNGAPRTAIDATATVDVSSLSRNGGRPPQWLINLALWATLPWVWPQTLAVLRMIPDKSYPLGVRMHKDETGIYRKIRKHTRQQRAARAS